MLWLFLLCVFVYIFLQPLDIMTIWTNDEEQNYGYKINHINNHIAASVNSM